LNLGTVLENNRKVVKFTWLQSLKCTFAVKCCTVHIGTVLCFLPNGNLFLKTNFSETVCMHSEIQFDCVSLSVGHF